MNLSIVDSFVLERIPHPQLIHVSGDRATRAGVVGSCIISTHSGLSRHRRFLHSVEVIESHEYYVPVVKQSMKTKLARKYHSIN